MAMTTATGRVPVTLLTGFLGAGKTSLINRLVTGPDMASVAVLINEFGEIGIDHHLVERIDDALAILESGCLCCTVRGELISELQGLHDRMARREIPPVTRILIETTGLANPAPVVRALTEDRFVSARFLCDGIVTVVDAVHGRATLEEHGEARVQVAMADRLVLSKTDLAGRAERAAVEARLAALNPSAPVLDGARDGGLDPAELFGGGCYASEAEPADPQAWVGHVQERDHDHDHGHDHPSEDDPHFGSAARSFSVRLPGALSWRGFALRLGQVLARWEGRILRLKGIVAARGRSEPMAIQCVGRVAYPPVALSRWPSSGPLADGRGVLVVIGEGLTGEDEAAITALLTDCPDDRAALRQAMAIPGLPTRPWLAERIPLAPPPGMESDAFVIQPRYLR
ncbi:CobW family GTP-binding protein [Rhodospirillum sp. A1_3_36]|uniref:CobW family GTP-binding protein n=1 Tax=Rhodospirillum sp. A1_3_36 TaxID=3391666 RepID=UPI0039A7587D